MRYLVVPYLCAGMIGDAWAGGFEGTVGAIRPPFPKRPALSDDTQLTIATAEAILESRGRLDPAAIAQRFRRWFESGRLTGLGSSTLKSLRDLSAGAHWALAGARGEFAAGAGAAMRAAPLAFFLDPSLPADRRTLRDITLITHHNDEAYSGALAIVTAIHEIASAKAIPSDLLSRVAEQLPDTAVRDRVELLDRDPPRVLPSSGHVVDVVPTALLLTLRTKSVVGVIQASIQLGGDTDTIAALGAQLVAASGAEVPFELVERIPDSAQAHKTFTELSRL